MKVLQLNTEKGWRGGERQTLLTSIGLKNLGHQVGLLCLEDLPVARNARAHIENVLEVKNQAECTKRLVSLAKYYDVIHAQSSRAFGCAALSSFLHETPVIYTRRVDFVPRGSLTRLKYSRASAVAAISPAIQRILLRFGLKNVPVISSIVREVRPDVSRAKAVLSDKGIPANKRVIGVVGALVGHKDPLTMIRAAGELKSMGDDFVVVHFGDGPLKNEAAELIKALNLKKEYRMMGYMKNVEDFFSCFDVFAMSSNEEGLGSSVLDAFYNRVPVASTSAGGLKELVQGRGGLCRPEDPKALAENINYLLNNPEKASVFASKAYEYVISNHSMPSIAQAYSDLYEKVVGT
ncbi:MAG: glycosyltransferase family 4 protein [Chitinispirillaceae bacterium]